MKEKGRSIIALRKVGKTYGEIEKILNLPKSTVAWWSKKVKITASLKKKMLKRSKDKWRKNIAVFNKKYAKLRSEEARLKRDKIRDASSKDIVSLGKEDLRLIGAALYWAEGNTKDRHRLQFTNSKPEMIQIMMRFFREVCGVQDDKIRARIHTYPELNYRKTLNFWSKLIGLSKNNFHAPQIKISKSSKRKRNRNTLPYGTVYIIIANTEITAKVQGWIKGMVDKLSAGVVQW